MQPTVCHTTSPARAGHASPLVLRTPCSVRASPLPSIKTHARRTAVVTRAQDAPKPAAEEDDFEARIAALKLAKGQTPMGEGKKKGVVSSAKATSSSAANAKVGVQQEAHPSSPPVAHNRQVDYDYSNETLYLETPPSYGDLAVNVALGITLVWIPLTIAAVGRTAFVKYRFTDKRISVITNAPWKQEQLDAAYQEVRSVVAIGRGVGAWGDMVVELKSGDKIEMRAVPRWQELRDYITERAKAVRAARPTVGAPSTSTEPQGFGQ